MYWLYGGTHWKKSVNGRQCNHARIVKGEKTMRIAVTGTPGTGKTTMAQIIAEKLEYRYINLGKFAENHGLAVEEDAERNTRVVDEESLKNIVRDMDNVVFDGHYAEQLDPDITFVLRCPPQMLKTRLEKKFGPKKVRENLLAEILDSCLVSAAEHNDPEKVFEIENTSIEKTIEKIMRLIKEKRPLESIAYKKTCTYLNEDNLTLL